MLDVLITAHSLSLTGTADSAALWRDMKVAFRERMPAQAMGLGSVGGSDSVAAQDVDSQRDRLKMSGIHAESIPAQVVNREPFGNGADKQNIGKPVDKDHITISPTKGHRAVVPVVASGSCPDPTRCAVPKRAIFVNAGPEPYLWADTRSPRFRRDCGDLAASSQASVVQVAVSPGVVRIQAISDAARTGHSDLLAFDVPSIAEKE